ncbi:MULTISPECIES: hypothetical protein [Olivibacter]|uniref:Uncharacterized protein n=1 Tax=Olivibacter jilunii TaxID=985016 RepID=A0ABW6AZ83_9SPHI
MAITILQKPAELSFSGNGMLFKVKSDRAIASMGTKAQNAIDIIQLAVGDSIKLDYGNDYIEIKVVDNPNNLGYEVRPVAIGETNKGSAILSALQNNFYLNRHFDLSASGNQARLYAKEIGSQFNISPRVEENKYSVVEGSGEDAALLPNFKIMVEIYLNRIDGSGYDIIYTEQLNTDNLLSDELTIDVSKALNAALEHDIPDFNDTTITFCKKSKRTYYVQFTEVYGDNPLPMQTLISDIFHVAKGGLSYHGNRTADLVSWLNREPEPEYDRFLKQGDSVIKVRTNQPEYLHFINLRSQTSAIRLKIELLFADESIQTIVLEPISVSLYDKLCIPTGYTYLGLTDHNPNLTLREYKVSLINQNQQPISQKITYKMDYFYREIVRYFCYSTSLSGIDTLATHGRVTASYEFSQEESRKPRFADYKLTDGDYTQFNQKIRRTFKAVTNYVTKRQFDLLTDFVLSKHKFIVRTFRALPISVDGKEFGKHKDLQNLHPYEFEYMYNFEDDHYTEGDSDDNGAYIDELYLPESANNSHFTYTFPFLLS